MYKVSKRMEIAGSHQLKLDYESKCENLHGHNWLVTVEVTGQKLNNNSMLIDFSVIKNLIHDKLDHKNLNQELNFNPTAENISKWIADTIDDYLSNNGDLQSKCTKVKVEETSDNYAEWSRD